MEHVLQVDVLWVSFVAGSIIPLLTGLVTKLQANSSVKSLVNLILSVAAGVCTVLVQAQGKITVQQLVIGVFTTLMASGVTYSHVWKPTGVANAVQELAPERGIGTVGTDQAAEVIAPSVAVPEPIPEPAPADPPPGEERIVSAKAAQDHADRSLLTGKRYLAVITPVLSNIDLDD